MSLTISWSILPVTLDNYYFSKGLSNTSIYGFRSLLNLTLVVDFWTDSGIRSHIVIPRAKGLLRYFSFVCIFSCIFKPIDEANVNQSFFSFFLIILLNYHRVNPPVFLTTWYSIGKS